MRKGAETSKRRKEATRKKENKITVQANEERRGIDTGRGKEKGRCWNE